MKSGEFKLKGFAVDCSGLPALGDAGKEIFRALKVVVGGEDSLYSFDQISEHPFFVDDDKFGFAGTDFSMDKEIQPSDVLGQAAIDVAMKGATIVFEGDNIPKGFKRVWQNRQSFTTSMAFDGNRLHTEGIIAYKILGELPENKEDENTLSNFGAEFESAKSYSTALYDYLKAQTDDVCLGGDGDLDPLAIGGHRKASGACRDGNEGEEVELSGDNLKYKPIFNDDKEKETIEAGSLNIRNAITHLEQAKEGIDRRIEALKGLL